MTSMYCGEEADGGTGVCGKPASGDIYQCPYCRIAELEAALAEAREKYVQEGIERVRHWYSDNANGAEVFIVGKACDRARAAFNKEQNDE